MRIDEINESDCDDLHFVEFEKEPNFEAIELLKKGIIPTMMNELAVHIGITLGILSMFYFRFNTGGLRHPHKEERLVAALNQLELKDNSPCWGIALMGINLWVKQFNLEINRKEGLKDKNAFNDIFHQVKELEN
jgi:hypothetical protein